jgi:hypothetical protein
METRRPLLPGLVGRSNAVERRRLPFGHFARHAGCGPAKSKGCRRPEKDPYSHTPLLLCTFRTPTGTGTEPAKMEDVPGTNPRTSGRGRVDASTSHSDCRQDALVGSQEPSAINHKTSTPMEKTPLEKCRIDTPSIRTAEALPPTATTSKACVRHGVGTLKDYQPWTRVGGDSWRLSLSQMSG